MASTFRHLPFAGVSLSIINKPAFTVVVINRTRVVLVDKLPEIWMEGKYLGKAVKKKRSKEVAFEDDSGPSLRTRAFRHIWVDV